MTKAVKRILIAVIAVMLLAGVVVGVVGVGVYGRKQAVRKGNETAAVSNLKTIHAAEMRYYENHDRRFGTFDQLVEAGMLDSRFAGNSPTVYGYIFRLRIEQAGPDSATFAVHADPESSHTGTSHFSISWTSRTVHVNSSGLANSNDPQFSD